MSETKPKVINGISFAISQPYGAGHVLTELEAKVLNQTRSENVGNNVRAKIKDMLEEGKSEADIQAYVAGVDAEYVFRTVSEGAGRSVDPYEREALKIARDLLKDHLATTGRKITVTPDGLTDDEWKDKVSAEVERIASTEVVLKAAKKNVDAKRKQANELLEAVGGVGGL
jgi:hypothetical protein